MREKLYGAIDIFSRGRKNQVLNVIFTARKRSCRKVMFFYLSVILFMGGGLCIPACNGPGYDQGVVRPGGCDHGV